MKTKSLIAIHLSSTSPLPPTQGLCTCPAARKLQKPR